MQYIFVAAGLFLLIAGGDALVRGAVGLARSLGMSPLLISLTVVAYGTSAPELIVSLDAYLTGATDIAVGNVVGSNIANILLIVGTGALISPMTWARGAVGLDSAVMLVASGALLLLGLGGGVLTFWSGSAMLALLAAYTAWQYRKARRRPADAPASHADDCDTATAPAAQTRRPWAPALALLCGLAGVVLGIHLLVAGAVGLARSFGVSEATIGLTLVAVGTSLPELATTVAAAARRHAEVALGTVIGSNIFNVLGILGLVPLFGVLPIPESVIQVDLWIMFGITLLFVVWTTMYRFLGRAPGAACLIAYAAYVIYQYLDSPGMPATMA